MDNALYHSTKDEDRENNKPFSPNFEEDIDFTLKRTVVTPSSVTDFSDNYKMSESSDETPKRSGGVSTSKILPTPTVTRRSVNLDVDMNTRRTTDIATGQTVEKPSETFKREKKFGGSDTELAVFKQKAETSEQTSDDGEYTNRRKNVVKPVRDEEFVATPEQVEKAAERSKQREEGVKNPVEKEKKLNTAKKVKKVSKELLDEAKKEKAEAVTEEEKETAKEKIVELNKVYVAAGKEENKNTDDIFDMIAKWIIKTIKL